MPTKLQRHDAWSTRLSTLLHKEVLDLVNKVLDHYDKDYQVAVALEVKCECPTCVKNGLPHNTYLETHVNA